MPPPISGCPVVVGSTLGNPLTMYISERARANCPSLSTASAGSEFPSIPPQTFQILLQYLDGEDPTLSGLDHGHDLPLQFAQAWTLAGKLHLPYLQDRLIDRMQTLYNEARRARTFAPGLLPASQRRRYPTDESLKKAFDHLTTDYGSDTYAEQLLVCFVSRAAPDIKDLELQIRRVGIPRPIRKAMLKEARSLEPDPIRFDLQRFKGNTRSPIMPLIVRPSSWPVATSHTPDSDLRFFEDHSSLGLPSSDTNSDLGVLGHPFLQRFRRPGASPPSTLMPHLRGGAGSANSSMLESFRSSRSHARHGGSTSTVSPLDSISSAPRDSMIGSSYSAHPRAHMRRDSSYASSRVHAPSSSSLTDSRTSRSNSQQQGGDWPTSRNGTGQLRYSSSPGCPPTVLRAKTDSSICGRRVCGTQTIPPPPPSPPMSLHMPHNGSHRLSQSTLSPFFTWLDEQGQELSLPQNRRFHPRTSTRGTGTSTSMSARGAVVDARGCDLASTALGVFDDGDDRNAEWEWEKMMRENEKRRIRRLKGRGMYLQGCSDTWLRDA